MPSQRPYVRARAVCSRSCASTGSGTRRRALRSRASCRVRTYSSNSSTSPCAIPTASVPVDPRLTSASHWSRELTVGDVTERLSRRCAEQPYADARLSIGCVTAGWEPSCLLAQRQLVVAARKWFDQAVGDQAVQRPGPLCRLLPYGVERRLRNRGHCLAQHGEQPAAHLPVGTGIGLTAARGP